MMRPPGRAASAGQRSLPIIATVQPVAPGPSGFRPAPLLIPAVAAGPPSAPPAALTATALQPAGLPPYSGWWRRVGALLLDNLIVDFLIAGVVFFCFAILAAGLILLAVPFGILGVWRVSRLLIYFKGRTPGKRALGSTSQGPDRGADRTFGGVGSLGGPIPLVRLDRRFLCHPVVTQLPLAPVGRSASMPARQDVLNHRLSLSVGVPPVVISRGFPSMTPSYGRDHDHSRPKKIRRALGEMWASGLSA